jgi:formimidoylglutamate deiminase
MSANAGQSLLARQLFDGGVWRENVPLEWVPGARNRSDAWPQRSSSCVVIPGMINVHSHAFQFGFAGMAESQGLKTDNFWTWRRAMYSFLECLGPDEMYKIAVDVYRRMLGAGYSAVGEFHYVHHDPRGIRYADETILADSVIRAAEDVGLPICLLFSFYARGGFDDSRLEGAQRRFGYELDGYISALEKLAKRWNGKPNVLLGIAPHSLRAVDVMCLATLVEAATKILPGCPIHMHLAEQQAEVDASLARTGLRPGELLLENVDLDDRWCLIHGTHTTRAEMERLAARNVTIGLCPSTEANLGDGVFPAEIWASLGGSMAIGSDSQITINPFSELRQLEYSQRLRRQSRVILASSSQSNGRWLYEQTLRGGGRALRFPFETRPASDRCDWALISERHPGHLRDGDKILDSLVFQELGPVIDEGPGNFRCCNRPNVV